MEKLGHYKFFTFFFSPNIKVSGTTYYQINREVMLKRTNEYYENNKELLREKAKGKYRELSENGRSFYHNMSKEKK